MKPLLVDDLIDQVRSKIDLDSVDGIDDDSDILPALNRGQKYAFDILSRQYPEPLLKRKEIPIIPSTELYEIPVDAFEDRLLQVEVRYNNTFHPIDRISYRQLSLWSYQDQSSSAYPQWYVVEGRKFRLAPKPGGGVNTLRLWYIRQPEHYVKQQGRITAVDTANNYVIVDSIGADLSTDAESLKAYVNVIDPLTGLIKASLQIQSIDTTTKKIVFKASPTRTTVLAKTVVGDLSSLKDEDGASISLSPDDYLCSIQGTCIPQYKDPISNFVIEYATAEMKDKLQRENLVLAQQVLEKFEKQVKDTWAKRELSHRITRSNRVWNRQRGNYWRILRQK